MATNGAELTSPRLRTKAANLAAAAKAAAGSAVSAFTQTYATADLTVAAPTAVTTSLLAVATTGATNSSPYGYTSAAQADAIRAQVNLLIIAVTALIADDLDNRQTLTAIIDLLQALGDAT